MSRPPITFHILDTASGQPAEGIRVELDANVNSEAGNDNFCWEKIGNAVTNDDGRGSGLIPPNMTVMTPGVYRMTFHTMEYFSTKDTACFYPKVEVIFKIVDPSQHYHVPLLLSPFGYSTYKGTRNCTGKVAGLVMTSQQPVNTASRVSLISPKYVSQVVTE